MPKSTATPKQGELTRLAAKIERLQAKNRDLHRRLQRAESGLVDAGKCLRKMAKHGQRADGEGE